jgi:hypothetical protein
LLTASAAIMKTINKDEVGLIFMISVFKNRNYLTMQNDPPAIRINWIEC